MLKVVKTDISEEEFIKEVQELFPGKYTEEGLKVLFEYIENRKDNEYELYKIGGEFEEWTFEKYNDYASDAHPNYGNVWINLTDKYTIGHFLHELIYEDDWYDYIVGITNNTIMFTTYYASDLT